MVRSGVRVFSAILALFISLPLLAKDVSERVAPVRTITFHGLPTVTYDVEQSHLSAVRVDNRVVLIVASAPDGGIQLIEAPGRWLWRFSGMGGNIHHQFSVTGGHGQYDADVPMNSPQVGSELPVFLDTIREELGLPEAWRGATTARPVGLVGYDIEDSATHSTLIRLREAANDVRIGLSNSGEPLFYDLRLPISVPDAQNAAVPTRLIVSHTGRIQLALPAPRQNAITSVMWSTDPMSRRVTYQHFVLDAPAAGIHSLMTWQCGAYYSCYEDPVDGYTCWWQDQYCYSPDPPPPPPPDPGGCSVNPTAPSSMACGGGTTPSPQQQQSNQYVSQGCNPVPSASQFLDRSAYNANGLANYFSFDAFKSAGADYVLVDQALVRGLSVMQSELDTMSLPGLSKIGQGAGYRLPGENSGTPCGDHCYGTAVDLTIPNSSGAHDCHIWNTLAGAANAAGGWVEPADDIRAGNQHGILDHFHVAFDGRTNQPSDYGDACNP
jgi:hypothetical protein